MMTSYFWLHHASCVLYPKTKLHSNKFYDRRLLKMIRVMAIVTLFHLLLQKLMSLL